MFDELPDSRHFAKLATSVAPYGIAGRRHTLVAIQNSDGKTLASRSWGILTSSPGIYTVDSSGSWAGCQREWKRFRGVPVANPAPHSSTVVLSVVGLGLTDPAADGLLGGDITPVPQLPVAVQIGGADAPVVSIQQGSAPGMGTVKVPNAARRASYQCIVDSRPSVGGPTLAIVWISSARACRGHAARSLRSGKTFWTAPPCSCVEAEVTEQFEHDCPPILVSIGQ